MKTLLSIGFILGIAITSIAQKTNSKDVPADVKASLQKTFSVYPTLNGTKKETTMRLIIRQKERRCPSFLAMQVKYWKLNLKLNLVNYQRRLKLC